MDREKMMDLWRKQFEKTYYDWQLTPQVYDYLEGKINEVPERLLTGRKYFAFYDSWIVKELDGENSELARRMLVVISKVRSEGLINGNYHALEDAKICLRIGYDFDSIVSQSIVRYREIGAVNTCQIARGLIEYHPADSEKFADKLLSPEILQELITKRKSTRELYLALYLGIELIKKDNSKYNRYLPVIEDMSQQISGEYIIVMLYEAYRLSSMLKENLLNQLSTNTAAAKTILHLTSAKNMVAFLNSIGAPRWPYYYLVMVDGLANISKPETFNKLYKEDKETFMQLYERLSSTNNSQEFMYASYMLAIMLNNGDNHADPDSNNLMQLAMFKRLLTEYTGDKHYELPDLANETIPLAELSAQIKIGREFAWGSAETIIGAFAVLYDYSARSRRFIHLLLMKTIKSLSNYGSRSYVAGFFIDARKNWLSISPDSSLNTLLESEADFKVADTFVLYCFAHTSYVKFQDAVSSSITAEFIKENKEDALGLLNDGRLSIDETMIWTDLLYKQCKFDDYSPLVSLLGNKSKLVRKKAEELIADNEEQMRPLLEERLPKLKGEALAAAKRLIKKWDNERKFGANFTFTDNSTVIEFCTDNYDPENKKFISWIPEDMFMDVQFADLSAKAPAVVMQYILSEYMSLEEPYKIKACDKIVECLNPQDFQAAMENIYRLWMDTGAEAKKKMIMVPYCIYASDSQILRLRTQLKDWAEASRGAIAAFVVNAIAMNGGSVALMMIDGMSVKFPNNQVKNAAKAAFSFAAKALEIPEDELSDKIVPTLGFNKEGEKELDYGPRTFKVTLMPDFSLTIFDNDKQKIIKSMPAPAASDDSIKATAAKKEFSELKKQIKATVQSQTNRLEKVLMNGRCWTASAWNNLFVENPIMHRFATGLIWGVYKDKQLTDTFRYMDDGTFNTVDEEEYTLPEDAQISLVHPIELPAETVSQWQQQLDDYEVVQPFAQLSAPVVTLETQDVTNKKVTRYVGTLVKSGKISGMAKKYNLVRGEVWDGGSYTLFHWVDKYLNIAAQINFEYMYMGQEYNEDVTLSEVIFYRLKEDEQVVEEPKANVILEPSEVPARFVSTVIGTFDALKD